jgi:hypothetical protein
MGMAPIRKEVSSILMQYRRVARLKRDYVTKRHWYSIVREREVYHASNKNLTPDGSYDPTGKRIKLNNKIL